MSLRLATTCVTILALLASGARAAQVQDLVRVKGAEVNKLVGMGLVIGLKGTGDGGKYAPSIRALAELVKRFVDPTVVAAELTETKNVALVALSVEVSGAGARDGDRLDVQVSAVNAKSLEGGRLFLIPMTGPRPNDPIYALAEGALVVEDAAKPATAVIRGGAIVVRDIRPQLMDEQGRLTLVINDASATWPVAYSLASLINSVMAPDEPAIAKAVDQKNVVVQVPAYQRSDPAMFISQILQSYVDPSQISTGARVVINEKTNTIVVSGEVQISPVIISHKGLTITTITPAPVPTPQNPQVQQQPWVGMDPQKRGGAKLADLLAAFNQLKVEAPDRIAILKELARSGKLHAQVVFE